jgi:hypothetical protein
MLDTRDGAVARNVVFVDPSLFRLYGLPEVVAHVETGAFEQGGEP